MNIKSARQSPPKIRIVAMDETYMNFIPRKNARTYRKRICIAPVTAMVSHMLSLNFTDSNAAVIKNAIGIKNHIMLISLQV